MLSVKKLSHRDSLIESLVLIGLLSLFVIFNNKVFGLLFFVLVVINSKDISDMVPAVFVTNLCSNYFMVWSSISLGRLLCVMFVVLSVFRIIRYGKLKADYTKALYFIMIVELFSMLLSKYDNKIGVTTILNWLLIISAEQLTVSQSQVKRILNNTVVYSIVILLCVCISSIIAPNMVDGRLSVGRGTNANNFAMMVVQLTVITISFFLIPKNKSVPLFVLLPVIGFGVYLLLLSGSRTGLLACVLTIAFLFLLVGKIQGKSVSYFVVLLCATAVALVIMSFITNGDNYLAQRFSIEDIKQSGGSGRLSSIEIALNHVIPENLLFGVGPSTLSEIEAYQVYVSGAASCHNILISMLAQIGILGTIPHFYFIFRVLIKCVSSIRKKPEFVVPFALIFAALINGIGEIVYLERFFWCVMSLAVIMLNNMGCQNGVMYENK